MDKREAELLARRCGIYSYNDRALKMARNCVKWYKEELEKATTPVVVEYCNKCIYRYTQLSEALSVLVKLEKTP